MLVKVRKTTEERFDIDVNFPLYFKITPESPYDDIEYHMINVDDEGNIYAKEISFGKNCSVSISYDIIGNTNYTVDYYYFSNTGRSINESLWIEKLNAAKSAIGI